MKLEKCMITFNSEESVEFLIDTFKNSFEEVEASLERFKETEDYENDLWYVDDVLAWLESDDIGIIPLNIDTVYEFYLPDGENK